MPLQRRRRPKPQGSFRKNRPRAALVTRTARQVRARCVDGLCPTGGPLLPRYDRVVVARFRFMVIDEDGQRMGRFESGDPSWRAGDTFTLDEQLLRIVEILPEVSTMVAYNAVWVVTPAAADEQATDPAVADAVGRTRR